MRKMMAGSVALAAVIASGGAAPARATGCQPGVASAPFIDVADMRAIDHAVRALPSAPASPTVNVGSLLAGHVRRAAIPAEVVKVLPQYRGYQALRMGRDLAIVHPPSGRLVYLLPLGDASPKGCPP